MSRHECRGEDCGYCARQIDAVEAARAGQPVDWTPAELDQRADGAAADMVYGREWN